MPKRLPGSREEDSWLSERQLAGLTRADQLHMIRESFSGPLALRAMSQGAGAAASAAGFDKNPFNAEGLPDELGRPWSAWNPSLGQTPITGANFHLVKFIKDVYLDSQVAVAILSNAPLGLFEPPDGAKPRIPRSVDESLSAMNLTGYQTAAVRDWVNGIAGSTRLLAHGQIFPGRQNLGFMQQQIDQFHPDSWKGYNIAYTAKLDDDPQSELKQWRLDDEQVAYPSFELIRNHRKELAAHPGFFNICIHKGLAPAAPDTPEQC